MTGKHNIQHFSAWANADVFGNIENQQHLFSVLTGLTESGKCVIYAFVLNNTLLQLLWQIADEFEMKDIETELLDNIALFLNRQGIWERSKSIDVFCRRNVEKKIKLLHQNLNENEVSSADFYENSEKSYSFLTGYIGQCNCSNCI